MFETLTKLNYIIFQLVRVSGTKTTEEFVFSLAVLPEMLNYQYGNRASVTQTMGTDEVNTFKDAFGRAQTRVTLRGSFGNSSKMQGISWETGYQRLVKFREYLVKLSMLVPDQKKKSAYGTSILKPIIQIPGLVKDYTLKNGEVWAVNYYDFSNNEKFSINIESFNIVCDARQSNNLPIYTLQFSEIGDIISTKSSDEVLETLLMAENVFGAVIDNLNGLISKIDNSATISAIKKAATFKNLAFNTLGVAESASKNALNVFNDAKNVFSGKTIGNSVSRKLKSIF